MIYDLIDAQKLSARAGYRMTEVDLELPKWNENQKEFRLTGCSLTGFQDFVYRLNTEVSDNEKRELNNIILETFNEIVCNAPKEVYEKNMEDYMTLDKLTLIQKLLLLLKFVAREAAFTYADELGLKRPLLVTTIKPEGTLSILPTVSPGLHYSHSPYYIRRIRINKNDPLFKITEKLGYNINNEVGQKDEDKCTIKVVDFYVKSHSKITKNDVTVIDQLENYKLFMKYYVDHNASCTITVKPDEWEIATKWLYDNWDDVIGITFLALVDSQYELMPYEEITEDQYNELIKNNKKFVQSVVDNDFELDDYNDDSLLEDSECSKGSCPIR